MANAAAGVIDCVIDDNPARQGCTIASLPVVSLDQAVARGVRAVIITADGAIQDAIWAKRGAMRERGLYVLTCPNRFAAKPWDDCLIDQFEATMAVARGLKPLYTHSYPSLNHRASPALAALFVDELHQATIRAHSDGSSRKGVVAEIGAGTGLLTEHLLPHASHYSIVDFSARLLHEAIEHRFAKHVGSMSLLHDETASMRGIPDASVDLVASFDVFVHIKIDVVPQYLTAFRRILKPTGAALIHFVQWAPPMIAHFERDDLPTYTGRPNYFEYLHPEQLANSGAHLGLKVECFQNLTADSRWFMRVTHG